MSQQQLYLEPSLFEDAEQPLPNYINLQLLLDSLTSGPRPNWALLESMGLCPHELYLVRQQPSLLVGPLTGFMRRARLSQHPQLELSSCAYYLQRLQREAFAARGHSTLQQLLLQGLGAPQEAEPPVAMVMRLCLHFNYFPLPSRPELIEEHRQLGTLSFPDFIWSKLVEHHRQMGALSFPDFISYPQASVSFFEAFPVQTWELLYNSTEVRQLSAFSRNDFFYHLLCCGQDEAVLFLCESTLEFPVLKRSSILEAAYLTAVAMAEPDFVRRLWLACPIDCPAQKVVDMASLEMLEYLETVYLDFHGVSLECKADRLEAAIDTADPFLMARLLDLYPEVELELDLKACAELLLSTGSVAMLKLFEARVAPLEFTAEDLETVGQLGCYALACHLCDADASRADAIVAGAQADGRTELVSRLRARYPAAVKVSDD